MLATENSLRRLLLFAPVALLMVLAGCTPAGPRALLDGDAALQSGKLPQAIEHLDRATKLMPEEPRAWNLLGLAYHRSGQPQLAAQAYRQALAKDRSNFVTVAHFNLGCLLLEEGHPAPAVDALRSFTLMTNSAAGHAKLGAAQLRLRQLDAAERSFNAARQLEATNVEALNGLGVIRAYRGQRDALKFFNAALQQDPKFAPAILNVAVLTQGHPSTKAAALERYRDYLALAPKSTAAVSVQQAVRQLEAELAPPPTVAPTNVVVVNTNVLKTNALAAAVRTNVPPPAVTSAPPRVVLSAPASNAPAPVAVVKTNPPAPVRTNTPPVIVQTPPPKVLKTNPPVPVATNTPAAAPEPVSVPVEVIAVAPAAPPKIAGDIEPALPARTPPPAGNPPPAVASPNIISSAPSVASVEARDEESKKRGFLSRMNPFRKRGDKTEEAPELPPPSESPRVAAAPSTNASAAPVAVAPPPKPSFPRYTYTTVAAPKGGNRTEAERAMQQGTQAHRAGNTNEAFRLYHAALRTDPAFFDAQYNLALLLFHMGALKESLAAWERALAIEPDSINARYNFALALKQANHPHDAAAELEKIIEAKPDEVRAHLTLGNIYAQQLEEKSRARPHYMKVVQLDPRNAQAPAIRFWLAANP